MIRQRRMVLAVAVSFAALALGLIGIFDRSRALRNTVHQNCIQLERLKEQLRPEPFNPERTKQILRDLNIDPGSPVGRRLMKQAEADRKKERARLAPREC